MEGWMQGSLARIKLSNFVTYDSVEFKTGPHLNIIIGPNGTGKSSIVCALCLGLGGKTNLLGRAREVGEFVKHGTDKATIELELYNKDGLNYTIKRVITRDNKSDWFLNKKPVNLKEITGLAKKLSIDVNNLCQFLPQDMVAEFAKMTQAQLLESTERAVGGQALVELHEKLITLKNEHKSVLTSQVSKEEYLDKLMKRNEYLKDIVSKHEERSNHLKKIEVLQLKRPWLVYEVARVKFQKLKESKNSLADRVEQLKAGLKPLKDLVDAKKSVQMEVGTVIKEMSSDLNKINSGLKSVEHSISSNRERFYECQEEYKSKVQEAETRISQINQLTNEVEAYKREMKDLPPIEDLKTAQDRLMNKCRDIAKELAKLESIKNELNIDENSRKSKQSGLHAQIQRLNDISNKKLESLRRSHERDTYNAVEWLRKNKHMFQGEVLEPFQLIINVPDTSNAKYIESIISRNDRKAFIFERTDDLNTFMKELRDNQKLSINAVHAPPNENFHSSFDSHQLKSLGFIGYLSDFIECPQLARRFLCKYYRIHNVPIGTSAVDKNLDRINKIITSGLYFTPTHRYQNNKSRYSSDTISSISQLKEARIFNLTVDTSQIQRLEQEANALRLESDEAKAKYNEVKSREQELRAKEQGYRDERTKIGNQIQQRQTLESKIYNKSCKLSQLENSTINLDDEKEKCIQKSNQAALKTTEYLKKMYSVYIKLTEKENEKNLATFKKIRLSLEVSDAEERLQSSSHELNEAQEALESHGEQVKRQRDFARQLLQEAKTACGLDRDNLPNSYKTLFKRYPCSDVNDLDQQLNEARGLAECSSEVDPQVITEYKNRKKEIETYATEVEQNQEKLKTLESQINTVREKWYGPVTSIVDQINEKFRSFFSKLSCAGEVNLSEHEDYDKWGIDIRVQFRNSDDMKRLTSHYQSGGEKSVSTILYLLSLQGLTECPFRVVDEINQGMDPKNERKVFEMMAHAATVEGTSQYFLITPKLLPDLDYNEKMTILGIFNGLGLSNTHDDSFIVEKVIEQNQIRCSQL